MLKMSKILNFISENLKESYESLLTILPEWSKLILNLLILVLIIFIYSVFIWKGYRFLAKKNLINLNLNQYNKTQHSGLSKILSITLYLIEYILITPIIIFLGYIIFIIFLTLLSEGLEASKILVISAAIIAVIRMTSYIPNKGEDLARDLAKTFPFMLLTILLLNPNSLQVNNFFESFKDIASTTSQALIYILFIITLEILMRFFDIIINFFGFDDVEDKRQKIIEEIKEKKGEEN
jgi:hypothetical protein